MAYNELIKNFDSIRDYIRDFYTFGFHSREDFVNKSARTYDNERRRIESWLGEYMSFHQNDEGKFNYISIDSREVIENPLYKAFKTKSFTRLDIMFHFFILDELNDKSMNLKEIVDEFCNTFYEVVDESTIRKKLNEYCVIGLLKQEKQGKTLVYSISRDSIDLESWIDAITFFKEDAPVGVVGSFVEDKIDYDESIFRFKHHLIIHALDSEVECGLLTAIYDHKRIKIETYKFNESEKEYYMILPLKIYSSTQTGRQHVYAYCYDEDRYLYYRLDMIHEIKNIDVDSNFNELLKKGLDLRKHVWGVSSKCDVIHHLEMDICVEEDEYYILKRLKREKRMGVVTKVDEVTYRFSVDVYDCLEVLPWVRTFIGRIIRFECSDDEVASIFKNDLLGLKKLYGDDYGI